MKYTFLTVLGEECQITWLGHTKHPSPDVLSWDLMEVLPSLQLRLGVPSSQSSALLEGRRNSLGFASHFLIHRD